MSSRQYLTYARAIPLLIALAGMQFAQGEPQKQAKGLAKRSVNRPERLLPAGSYLPFFAPRSQVNPTQVDETRKAVALPAFWLDTFPVTQGEYLEFVRLHPQWGRSVIGRVFADEFYLKQWSSDLKLHSSSDLNRPVVQISWFSAAAFCQSLGRELPTTDQWEYAAEDAGRSSERVKSQILKWYGAPNPKSLERVKKQPANGYGIHDLHGLIWEWTLDFNSAMIGSELRSDGTKDENLFCGAGSLNAQDASDYAKFMRYSLRSSLRADYTTANLGFRCAREEKR